METLIASMNDGGDNAPTPNSFLFLRFFIKGRWLKLSFSYQDLQVDPITTTLNASLSRPCNKSGAFLKPMIGKQSKYRPLPQLLKQQLSKITLLPVGQSDSPTMSVFKKILGEITHQYHYVIFLSWLMMISWLMILSITWIHIIIYHHILIYHPSSSINHWIHIIIYHGYNPSIMWFLKPLTTQPAIHCQAAQSVASSPPISLRAVPWQRLIRRTILVGDGPWTTTQKMKIWHVYLMYVVSI